MSQLLEQFQKQKERLNEAFDLIQKENIVPCKVGKKKYDQEDLSVIQQNMEEEVFTISVCGQINAGKSSFLNFLLFQGREVLPADDTPSTAKLSTISYGETDEATITYYSVEEWEKLKAEEYTNEDTGEKTTYYDQFLKKEVNRLSFNEGIHVEEYIENVSKIERSISLNKLDQYVAKNGKYTPFVSHIDITVNNPFVKGVKFVDTPGLNDRNILRSKVTEDWIIRSSAVVYLFYTGQPLSVPDYEFIDQHLSNLPSNKLLFVLTKADTSADYEGAIDYVEQTLRTDAKLKERGLLDGKQVYPISALAAKLKHLTFNNIELSEDDEYHLNRITDDCEIFLDKDGMMPELVSAIQKHIMQDKGASILHKSRVTIEDILNTKITELKKHADEQEEMLATLELSESELNAQMESISNQSKSVGKISGDYEEKKRDLLKDTHSEIAKCLIELENKIIKSTGIENMNSKSEIMQESGMRYILKKAIEKNIFDLPEIISELAIASRVNKFQNEYTKEIREVLDDTLKERTKYFTLPAIDLSSLVVNINLNELNGERLREAKVYSNSWNSFWRQSDLEETKRNIESSMSDVVKLYLKGTNDEIKGELDKRIEAFYKELTEGMNEEFARLTLSVDKLKKERNSKDNLVDDCKAKLKSLKDEQDKVQVFIKKSILPLLN